MDPRWPVFIDQIRSFMQTEGLKEVTTPQLVEAGAFEAAIDCFKVGLLELHTSPEIEMKWLLARDRESIFQICKVFRDDPTETGVHLKEFTMLEYYRVGATYEKLMDDIQRLVCLLIGKTLKFQVISLREYSSLPSEKFFRLLVEKIEPSFDPEVPTFVTDYPLQVSALAKTDGTVTQKFELYWKGLELCNGCTELGNIEELKKRYEIESRQRRDEGKTPHPPPNRLIRALEKGLPPSAGVAVGLDRLFWALYGRLVTVDL